MQSMFGATDFDASSDYSNSSQDFLTTGGFTGKLSLNRFIK